jgi:hypothetical protein
VREVVALSQRGAAELEHADAFGIAHG